MDSLRRRYFYKLGTRLIGIPIGFISSSIIPRALGVEAYGNFNYLTDFFSRLFALFDTGSSIGFYSKFSQRPSESSLVRFYWGFVAVICCIVLLLTVLIYSLKLQNKIWIGQSATYVWMALFWGMLSWINQIVNKILDAYGLTVKSELAIIQQRFLGIIILGALFVAWDINMEVFFAYNYLVLALMIYLWHKILTNNKYCLLPKTRLKKTQILTYGREFYQFSMPLLIGGIAIFILGFADRYLLQLYGGSVQQGFYSLSFKVGALCFLFTSSMVPLFQREISKAYGDGQFRNMAVLFNRFVPMFYSISVSISAFFFFQAETVSIIVGGNEFKNAALPVAIMSLYPIHQTYGQLNSTVFFAAGRTKLYRNIGLSITIVGLIVSYTMLAPRSHLGLNLGSTGLAIKMVIVQVIGQNVLLWYNTKFLNIAFRRMVFHQIYSVLVIGSAAALVSYATKYYFDGILTSFVVSGIAYIIALILILYYVPSIFSTSKKEVIRNIIMVRDNIANL